MGQPARARVRIPHVGPVNREMNTDTPPNPLPALRTPPGEVSGVWSGRSPVRVSFDEAGGSALATLTVTSPADWPVAVEVYRWLFESRIQVTQVEVRKVDGGAFLEHRLVLVEFDGAPLAPTRRRTIGEDLVGLLDAFGDDLGMA
jgi:hypothetical protein